MSFTHTESTLHKILAVATAVVSIVTMSGVVYLAQALEANAATFVDGDVVKTADNPDVYILKNVGAKKFKRLILNPDIFNSYGHLSWSNIKVATQAELDAYATSTVVLHTNLDGSVADPKVYAVTSAAGADVGEKRWLNVTAAQFEAAGLDWDSLFKVNATEAAPSFYPEQTALVSTDNLAVWATTVSGGMATPPAAPGAVSVSASGPASSTIVANQQTATLLNVVMSGTGTVTGITLERFGVSANTTPSNVYLFDGAVRLTDPGTVNSSNQVNFTNANGLFTVSGSKTIVVKSDIVSTASSGETVGFKVVAVTLLSGTASGLPASGSLHTVGSASLAAVAVAAPTPSAATVDAAVDFMAWRSVLTVSTRSVDLQRLALRNIGSINSADVKNFRLLVDGVQAAQVQNLDAEKYVTFDLMAAPLRLNTGTREFKVLADVVGGSGRTLQMSLRRAADLTVLDTNFNLNPTPTGTFAASAGAQTISSGSMSVTKMTDSPSGNITDASSDVSYAKYEFKAFGEPIKVETLLVGFDTDGTDADKTVRNVRVMVNGTQYGSTTDVAASATATVGTSFTTNFVVNPGTPATVEIRGDVHDSEGTEEFTSGSTILARLVVGSSNGVQQNTLGSINVPTATSVANTLTVQTAALTAVASPTYPAQTIVVPRTVYKVAEWDVTNTNTENVNVTTFSVDIDESSGTTFNESDLTDLYLTYDGLTSTVKSSASSNGQDNDWSVSYSLVKNKSIKIALYANVGSTITATHAVISDLSITATGASSGAAANASDVAGQVITANTGTFLAALDASAGDSKLLDDSGTANAAAFKFTSTNDTFTITDLTLTLASATTVSSVVLKDGATTVATRPGATSVTFSGVNVKVDANTVKVLTVEHQLSSVGVGAGTSASNVAVTLASVTSRDSAGTSYIDLSPETAQTDLVDNAADPVGNAMYVFKAVPLVSRVAIPSSTMINGTMTIAKFTVSDNGSGTVYWKELMLEATKTGGAAGDPDLTALQLWNADTGTQVTAAVAFQNSSEGSDTDCDNLDTTCELLISVGTKADDNVEQAISGTRTYEVRATVGGTLATGDNLTVKLDRNTTSFSANGLYTAEDNSTAAGNVSFTWSDGSASAHDTGTTDWTNDFLLKSLPTDTWSITK